jgi:TatD DNase family protein
MQWIDTHAHIDTPRFGGDLARREAALRAREVGIAAVVIPGIQPSTWCALLERAARLREEITGVCFHTALGVHPQALPDLDPDADADACATLEQHLAAAPAGLVAIGECGLDFGPLGEGAGASRARQVAVLDAHLKLSRRTGLPLLLHCLHAHAVLRERLASAPTPASILHSWSGSAELVRGFCGLGHCISFAGSITLPNARRPLAAARAVPPDRLLLETDSPDQTPYGRRPARNEPAFLPDIAAAVAAARDEPLADLAARTTANARRVLRLA